MKRICRCDRVRYRVSKNRSGGDLREPTGRVLHLSSAQASAGTESARSSTAVRIESAEYEATVTVSRPNVTV